MSDTETRTLITKLAEVMAAVSRVPKRGRNEFHGYDYATEADIAEAVRDELASRFVMLLPSLKALNKDGDITTVKVTFTFIDGESGETLASDWAGTGHDKGDKGLYKAMTGAEKYFLLKTFLMPTGDDPESDTATDVAAETPAPAPAVRPTPAPPQAPPPPAGAVVLHAMDPSPTNEKAYNVVDTAGTRYNLWIDGPVDDAKVAIENQLPVTLTLQPGKPKQRGGGTWPDTIKGITQVAPDRSPSADEIGF